MVFYSKQMINQKQQIKIKKFSDHQIDEIIDTLGQFH